MIKFMVLAAPRSGTAWAANLLTTDTSLCLHDPLWETHYADLDRYQTTKRFGISCTGSWMFPEWVNNHPAKKVILHRPLVDINESLREIGLPEMSEDHHARLSKINGLHLSWTDLFKSPKQIYEYLLEREFDAERFRLLRTLNVQSDLEKIEVNPHASRRLLKELAASLGDAHV